VFSGEQGAHVCSHLASSTTGPDTGGGCWKDGGTPTCNVSSSCNALGARHQGHALRTWLRFENRS
jgi:hypothetical protein